MTEFANREVEVTRLILADEVELTDEERKRLGDQTTHYFENREEDLNALVEHLRAAMSGDEDSLRVWQQDVAVLKLDAISSLDPLLSGITGPTKRAEELKWKISSEEEAFNNALFDAGVAHAWQQLALLARDTRTRIVNSDKEWGELVRKADEIQTSAESAITRLLTTLAESPGAGEPHISNLRPHTFAVTQAAREIFRVDVKPAAIRDLAEDAFAQYEPTLDGALKVMEGWRSTIPRTQSDIAALKSLQSAEIDGLHRVFREKRQAAQDFAREPATQKAKTLREGVDSAWSSMLTKLPSDGMRADATLLFEQLKPQLDQLVTMVNDAYAEFEREFAGRFLGAVSDETVEQLSQEDDWEIQRARFRLRDDPASLRTIKEKLADPVTDADRAFDEFKSLDTTPIGSERERTSLKSYIQSNRDKLTPRCQRLRTEMPPICDQGIAALEHQDLVAVVTREPVHRSLRS